MDVTQRKAVLAQKVSEFERQLLAIQDVARDIKAGFKAGLDVSQRILNFQSSITAIILSDRVLRGKGAGDFHSSSGKVESNFNQLGLPFTPEE